jgi:hypothetical protein
MQSNAIILLAVVCGFFLVLAGMVALVVYSARKDAEKKAMIAQTLGLSPVEDTQSLLQRVAYVNGLNRVKVYKLTQVFSRHHVAGGDVYLFSLHRSRFDEDGVSRGKRASKSHYFPLEQDALAFISPAWTLPRFSAMPRLSGGKLAEMGNRVAEAAMEIKHSVITFQHIPSLDDQYLIATPETPTSQVRPSDGFLRVLAAHPNLHIHGGGDTLTLSYADTVTNPPDAQRMMELYKIGMQMARELP